METYTTPVNTSVPGIQSMSSQAHFSEPFLIWCPDKKKDLGSYSTWNE